MTDENVKDWSHDYYLRQVGRIVEGLRYVAAQIERDKSNRVSYVDGASEIVNTVQWGVANLPLQNLLSAAREADDEHRVRN